MAKRIDLHPEDEQELDRLRHTLTSLRRQAGYSQEKMAAIVGKSEQWLNEFERGITYPHLSSLQAAAGFFSLRIEPRILGLEAWGGEDVPAAHALDWDLAYKFSRPFSAREWVRAWLMAELKAQRYASGLTAADLSRRLGLHVSAISGWERDGNDPLVSRIFAYVRALGGRMVFLLISPDEWVNEYGNR